MLLPQTIQTAYHLFFGKLLEDEAMLKELEHVKDVDHLRQRLSSSPEFRDMVGHWTQYVPEATSAADREVIVFQHIPKCGGTSFHQILKRMANERGLKMAEERHNGLLNWPLTHLLECGLFSGHYDARSIDFIPGEKKIITLLRDPKERLVSMYRFLRGHPTANVRRISPENIRLASLARQLSMEDFFLMPELEAHPSLDNGMVRQLSDALPCKRWEAFFPRKPFPKTIVDIDPDKALEMAQTRLGNMAAYGFVEDMDQSCSHIFAVLGFEFEGKILHKNSSDASSTADRNKGLNFVIAEDVSDKLAERLEALTVLDQKLYDNARANWQPWGKN